MSSLQIQDGFEPYFAGREAFPKPSPQRARLDKEKADAAREQGDDAAKSNADVAPGDRDHTNARDGDPAH